MEAAKAWEAVIGQPVQRTSQVNGKLSADLCGHEGIHFEVKRRARISATDYLIQAEADSADKDEVPVVLMRQDGDPNWIVMTRLTNLPDLVSRLGDQNDS